MSLTRRTLVKAGAAVLAVSAIPVTSAVAAEKGPSAGSASAGAWTGQLRKSDFDALLGDQFRVTSPAGRASLELIEVNAARANRKTGGSFAADEANFSVIFRSLDKLDQAVYRVDHKAIGTVDLLLVPVGGKEGRYLLEAVFNRTAPPDAWYSSRKFSPVS
jgi:hypothetical protein